MVAGVAVLGLLVWATAPAVAGSDPVRPFHVSLDSDFFVDGECEPGVPRQVITGTGLATHLGRFTIDGGVCLAPDPVPGQVTWTAANGDEIAITFVAEVGAIGPDGSAPIRLVSLAETGTGRFAHVDLVGGSPEGTVWFFDPLGLSGHIEAEGLGSISYDASDRSQ